MSALFSKPATRRHSPDGLQRCRQRGHHHAVPHDPESQSTPPLVPGPSLLDGEEIFVLCKDGVIIVIFIRDITQAYPQTQTNLLREILARLPDALKDKYPEDTIIRVINR